MRRQFNGRGPNEPELPGFARRVMAPAGISGDRTGDRGRNDDASLATRLEPREAGVHREEGALEIDIEHLIPIRRCHLAQPRGGENTSVATDDVDAAVAFQRGPRHSRAVFFVRNIGRHRTRARTNLGGRGLGLREVSRNQQNLGALARKDARDSFSDAFARASDYDRATLQCRQHNQTILAGSFPSAGSCVPDGEIECRALTRLGVGPDPAAMTSQHALHGGQTDAGSRKLPVFVEALKSAE